MIMKTKRERDRERYVKNKEHFKQIAKEWVKNNPERVKQYRLEYYRRTHPITFEICAICGEQKCIDRLCNSANCAARHRLDRQRKWVNNNREHINAIALALYHKNKKQNHCKICNAEIYRRTFCETCAKNRRALSEKKRKQTPEYKQKRFVYYREYQQKNNSKCKIWSVSSKSKMRKNLGDSYIKKLLTQETSLSYGDIPQELVELKRKQLEAVRLLKEQE